MGKSLASSNSQDIKSKQQRNQAQPPIRLGLENQESRVAGPREKSRKGMTQQEEMEVSEFTIWNAINPRHKNCRLCGKRKPDYVVCIDAGERIPICGHCVKAYTTLRERFPEQFAAVDGR